MMFEIPGEGIFDRLGHSVESDDIPNRYHSQSAYVLHG